MNISEFMIFLDNRTGKHPCTGVTYVSPFSFQIQDKTYRLIGAFFNGERSWQIFDEGTEKTATFETIDQLLCEYMVGNRPLIDCLPEISNIQDIFLCL